MSRRTVPLALREQVFLSSGGICQRCGVAIDIDTFHVSHLRAHASGGALVAENLEAWCSRCNLIQGASDVMDTRLPPRDWQIEALDMVVRRIVRDGAATVSAAPGAGKTVLAGLTFEALADAGRVDRMVVLVPRLALVNQWADALYRGRHLELKPGGAVERRDQQGVITTYQSLTAGETANHRAQAAHSKTLLVLDEVHHVGEPVKGKRPAWAERVIDLAGTVDRDQHVTGILNLSGTLWRSNSRERIATVRYRTLSDGNLESLVDFDKPVNQLIDEGLLRPLDLFRMDAQVSVADFANLERYEKWWVLHGNTSVAAFAGAANASENLGAGMRGTASVDQLRRMAQMEWEVISAWCQTSGKIPPKRRAFNG